VDIDSDQNVDRARSSIRSAIPEGRAMPKFSSKSAVLVFLALSIEPASAQGFRSVRVIPNTATFSQAQASQYGQPQGGSGAQVSYAQPGIRNDQPQGTIQGRSNSSRAASYCTVSGGATCLTLNTLGSPCECRDTFGRHFRGLVQNVK